MPGMNGITNSEYLQMAKKKVKAQNPFELEDWTEESLQNTWDLVKDIAVNKYRLEFYDPHFEVVSFEDMLHIYTGSLPIMYDHWSFGKAYTDLYKKYINNRMGVAYEVIFNTNPALCYLTEHNSPTMQGLVMAHASVGHSAFFRNNHLFKEMTNAAIIIPFLKNAKKFIADCEVQYGADKVEKLLDACHSLSLYAIDRRPIRQKTNKERESIRRQRAENKDRDYDTTLEDIKLGKDDAVMSSDTRPRQREENILKFIGKYSPALKQWQREIISIYCKIQQYLYPQMMTKLMNEGFASFWHHTIMSDLSDQGLLPPGSTLEFLHSHCSVLRQVDFDHPGYSGVNPYKLGYEIFKDIKRICEEPTEEDKEWFPALIGKDWVEEVKFAAYNFKDESFILQYLSPKVMRDLKLFVLRDEEDNYRNYDVSEIHDDAGYKEIRTKLSKAFNFGSRLPDIYVEGWDAKKSRRLYLCFHRQNGVDLDFETGFGVVEHIRELWPFPIRFKKILENGDVEEFE